MKKLFLLLFIMCFVSNLFAPIEPPPPVIRGEPSPMIRARGGTVVSRPGEYDPNPMHPIGSIPDPRGPSPIARSMRYKPKTLFEE